MALSQDVQDTINKITGSLKSGGEKVSENFVAVSDWFEDLWAKTVDWNQDVFGKRLPQFFSNVYYNGIVPATNTALDWLKNNTYNATDIFENTWNDAYSNFSQLGWDDKESVLSNLINNASNIIEGTADLIVGGASGVIVAAGGVLDPIFSNIENVIGGAVDNASAITEQMSDALSNISETFGSANSQVIQTVGKIAGVLSNSTTAYNDGVTETIFGALQEKSWQGTGNAFLNTFKSRSGTYRVRFTNSTPLDSGSQSSNLYGSMMLGVPPSFTNITDPANRSYINTFLQDAKFITLTPGLPRYNGTLYGGNTNNQLSQATSGNAMMEYLLSNGLNAKFANKDKRYYSFEAKYEEYFAYLETMLNTVWIKMGLGTEDNNTFNLFTFFKLNNNGNIDPTGFKTLLPQYNSSVGFFVNPSGSLSESQTNSPTSFGGELSGKINSQSETFNRVNYMTGMGTGGAFKSTARVAANTIHNIVAAKNLVSENLNFATQFQGRLKEYGTIAGLIGFAAGAILDAGLYTTENDLGADVQMFNTTNGMRVTYPELWGDSSFSRSININFEFVSPYGDPLSIFKYVMVPFCALYCFAMPRQADENGLVSPFLVRGDITGMFTVDLGLISDFTFTRGGNNDLWTKDGLPMAISGNFSIMDLYPFLSMTKRISFLSANPNYSVFLNSLAGLHAVYESDDNAINEYFRETLNRVSGKDNVPNTKLWNNYDINRRRSNATVANTASANKVNRPANRTPWMRKTR